jgi:peptide/nickel transport system substrate-binding protein
MRRRALLGGAAALAALPGRPARAQKFANTLRVSWSDAVTTLDPYASPLRTSLALMPEIWDGLIERDPDTLEMRPLLATHWRQHDPLSLDLRLRPGVWFHDGAPFGPPDVVATVQRVLGGEAVGIPTNYDWLQGAEQTGEMAVRLRFAHPFQPALAYLAAVLPILPRGLPPNAGIGTGPWRVESAALDRIVLARHEAYWQGSPKGATRIPRLEIAQPPDEATPFNDLVSGRCDWTWQLTPHQYELLAQAMDMQALRGESMRVAYLALDAAGRSDPRGPLTRTDVRQAVAHCIDRAKLGALAVAGGARPIDTPCYPTQFACDPVRAAHYDYDPATAAALLARAGLAGGFETKLVSYERPELVQAVADDLGDVGIRVALAILPAGEAMQRARDGQAPLFLGSWGSSSIDDMAAFMAPFFGGGPLDDARLPGLADRVAQAARSTEAERRRGLYGDAIQQITDQAAWLPLYVEAATYGISRTVAFHPTADELPRFYRVSWR